MTGDDEVVDAAFEQTWHWLTLRVMALLALPIETINSKDLAQELALIGQMEGAA